MKKLFILFSGFSLFCFASYSQNVGIGTTTPNEQLEITGNLRLPASTASVGVIKSGSNRFIHNFGTNNFFAGVNAGNLTMSGTGNTGVGFNALFSNSTGFSNTASGEFALSSNSTGINNTASGNYVLYSNTSGYFNTASGVYALYSNTTGNSNTASGMNALYSNAAGSNATAIGNNAMQYANNSATPFINYNVAVGFEALRGSTTASANTGNLNTALGYQTLLNNSTGIYNTASGFNALYTNSTGNYNTASGVNALFSNSTGSYNTASGVIALYSNSTGNYNTASGFSALTSTTSGFQNTSLGANSLVSNTTGSYNTALGYNTGPNAVGYFNTTCVGTDATATASDMVRIGNVWVGSIGGQVGWTTLSDVRFKENVKEDVPGLSFITQLRPVTYRLNREKINDFNGVNKSRQNSKEKNPDTEFLSGDKYSMATTGFIAQEVEQAAQMIGFNFSGVDAPKNENDMYGLRYAEFVVPLVKAVQELNNENKSLQLTIGNLQTTNDKLQTQLNIQQKEIEKIKEQLGIEAKK